MEILGWKVGELARQTGLSVRMLHHYDEIGLLVPARRSEAGYRLYDAENIARLQQIGSLRQLGFSLAEIRDLLDCPTMSPLQIVELHLGRIEGQIALQRQLVERLRALAWRLSAAAEVSAAAFLQIIEVMTMIENYRKYYTPEQLAALEQRRNQVGDARIREVEAEWPRLITQMRAAMERGDAPDSEEVQVLANRWKGLVEEFTGGNPGIERSLRTMYETEPAAREFAGIDERLSTYVGKAMAAGRQ